MLTDSTHERVFKALAPVGAVLAPFVVWIFTEVLSLRTENSTLKSMIAEVKKDVDHIPEVIELALMRTELAHANENLRKAIEGHEQQAQQVAPKVIK